MHRLSKSALMTAPIISDDYELAFFNCIIGYMMCALSSSQSMGLLQVIPGEGKAVRSQDRHGKKLSFQLGSNNANTPCFDPHIAYIQALGIHFLSYTMPLKPLAAKASVFNRNFVDDVGSSVATEPDFTEDRFYNDFSKMLGYGD